MEQLFKQIEENFDTVMSAFGIHGDCHITYDEMHPTGANFRGIVTCCGNMMSKEFFWQVRYWPASQTRSSFVDEIKARLFDLLVEVAKQTGSVDEDFQLLTEKD